MGGNVPKDFNLPPGVRQKDLCGDKEEDCLRCGETFPVAELSSTTGLCEDCQRDEDGE